MVKDKAGHSLEFKDYWDEDAEAIYWQYHCPIEDRNVIVTEHKDQGGKEEAMGKTSPYATCPICKEPMNTSEYDDHMKWKHSQQQRDVLEIQKGEEHIHSSDPPNFKEGCERCEHLKKNMKPSKDMGMKEVPDKTKGRKATSTAMFGAKYEATQVQSYKLTPQEFDAITKEAWEGEGCPECQDILQHIETEKDGSFGIYPSSGQAEHMSNLFGYSSRGSHFCWNGLSRPFRP